DADGDDVADRETSTRTTELERIGDVEFTFQPGVATVLNLKLVEKGTPYWSRPDLGIGKDDVTVQGRKVTVTVHSLGATDTHPTKLALLDAEGKMLATVAIPSLKAPADLLPKTVTLMLNAPEGAKVEGGSVVIDP